MALDAALLKLICDDINSTASGAKVDKIYQPERDEFVFVLRKFGDSLRLRVSSSSASPAVYFTTHHKENPKQAPALCMLMRKLFVGSKFVKAEQIGFDRIVQLSFECFDEMGDTVVQSVIVEIMNRNSNIVILNSENKIIDAVRRISIDEKSNRCILPGFKYTLPPSQGKLNPYDVTVDDVERIISDKEEILSGSILNSIAGISPIVSREVSYLSTGDAFSKNSAAVASAVLKSIKSVLELTEKKPRFYIVSDESIGKNIDFTFFVPSFYEDSFKITGYDCASEMLDSFYYSRDKAERIKQKSAELNRIVSRGIEHTIKRNSIQEKELAECDKADELKIRGELITANIYRIKPGSSFAALENFYDNGTVINIPLDSNLSAQSNAQRYFKEYKKLVNRKTRLAEQLRMGYEELEWLRSVADELSLADGENDISRIREELSSEGYIRIVQGKNPEKKKEVFESVMSDDGFTIYYGKNNLQNDQLTMKFASNNDIWFHARESFGSHVILKLDGKQPTDLAVYTAAKIAAEHSKSGGGGKISVDYTEVRNVRKPKGSKPGKVFYVNFKTIIV